MKNLIKKAWFKNWSFKTTYECNFSIKIHIFSIECLQTNKQTDKQTDKQTNEP